jgi:hypothetical protein
VQSAIKHHTFSAKHTIYIRVTLYHIQNINKKQMKNDNRIKLETEFSAKYHDPIPLSVDMNLEPTAQEPQNKCYEEEQKIITESTQEKLTELRCATVRNDVTGDSIERSSCGHFIKQATETINLHCFCSLQ